ncbi:MAG TPA: hypothetical protein VGI67_08970 [Thermoleophilaceae bacterium]
MAVVAHLDADAAVRTVDVQLHAVVGTRAAVQHAVGHKLADEQPQVVDPRQLLPIGKFIYGVSRGTHGFGATT